MTVDNTHVERCLLMVKASAESSVDEIIRTLKKAGFTIIQSQRVQLTPAEASDFYCSHSTKNTFVELVASVSSKPVTVIVCGKANCVADLNTLCGPKDVADARETAPESLSALYGTDGIDNGLHVSPSVDAAASEIRQFFPQAKLEPVPSVADTQAYLDEHINPTLLAGLTQLCKAKPDRPVEWIAKYLLANNPNQPQVEV